MDLGPCALYLFYQIDFSALIRSFQEVNTVLQSSFSAYRYSYTNGTATLRRRFEILYQGEQSIINFWYDFRT